MDFVRDAQWVKVKEDCEAIGVSVARLARDVGPCLKFDGTGPCTKSNRVDVLYSDGPDVTPADMSGDATANFYGGAATATELNWHKDDSRGDSWAQLSTRRANLPGDQHNAPARRSVSAGWRLPIAADRSGPTLLSGQPVSFAMATDAGQPKHATRGWSNDTFCVAQPRPVRSAFSNATHGVPPRRRLHLHHLRRHALKDQ
jgi:hypothetical protein